MHSRSSVSAQGSDGYSAFVILILADDPVAIISYDYWLRRFATSPDVLGRSIRIRNQAFSVVGVLSPDFTELDLGSAPDIWVPLRQHDGGRVLAALKPGVTARQLQSALQPALDNFLRLTALGER